MEIMFNIPQVPQKQLHQKQSAYSDSTVKTYSDQTNMRSLLIRKKTEMKKVSDQEVSIFSETVKLGSASHVRFAKSGNCEIEIKIFLVKT